MLCAENSGPAQADDAGQTGREGASKTPWVVGVSTCPCTLPWVVGEHKTSQNPSKSKMVVKKVKTSCVPNQTRIQLAIAINVGEEIHPRNLVPSYQGSHWSFRDAPCLAVDGFP